MQPENGINVSTFYGGSPCYRCSDGASFPLTDRGLESANRYQRVANMRHALGPVVDRMHQKLDQFQLLELTTYLDQAGLMLVRRVQ